MISGLNLRSTENTHTHTHYPPPPAIPPLLLLIPTSPQGTRECGRAFSFLSPSARRKGRLSPHNPEPTVSLTDLTNKHNICTHTHTRFIPSLTNVVAHHFVSRRVIFFVSVCTTHIDARRPVYTHAQHLPTPPTHTHTHTHTHTYESTLSVTSLPRRRSHPHFLLMRRQCFLFTFFF